MKKPPPVALIGAGKFSRSPITRMRNLDTQLGPVKAPSLRVASRMSNNLRAGHPVSDYQEFDSCELILISVPDDLLASVIAELTASLSSWQQKTVVACSDTVCCEHLSELASLGAATGTLAMVPGYEDRWFLVEGGKTVERLLRPMLSQLRATVIAAFQKHRYLQAVAGVNQQFMPCLKQASEALREVGIPGPEVNEIVERQVTRTMRSYYRSGKTV
jgi:hypothetical protein